MGWNPYAADYTRYFKPETSKAAIAWWSGLGLFLSCALLEIVGAAAATVVSPGAALGSNPTGAFTGLLAKPLADLTLLAIALGAVSANVLNIYSGALSFTAIGIKLPLSLRRAIVALGFGTIGFFLAWSGLHQRGPRLRELPADNRVLDRPVARRLLLRPAAAAQPGRDAAVRDQANELGGAGRHVARDGHLDLAVLQPDQVVGLVPKHVPSVGDLTFEVGFLITAVVYLGSSFR